MSPVCESQAAQLEERRAHQRYAVGLDLRYKLSRDCTLLEEGCGKTRDFSTGGMFVCTDRALPEGLQIELSLNWPVQMNGTTFLRLNVEGRIVRTTDAGSAIKIEQSQFLPVEAAAAG